MNTLEEVDILLVEGDPTDAERTIGALRKVKLADHLLWAKDGAEALRFFFSHDASTVPSPPPHPKLVLLELRLPKVDGFEVLRALKQDVRTCRIPVVVLTSLTQEKDILRSYENRANSVVCKPGDPEEFARVVAQLGLYWLPVNSTS